MLLEVENLVGARDIILLAIGWVISKILDFALDKIKNELKPTQKKKPKSKRKQRRQRKRRR